MHFSLLSFLNDRKQAYEINVPSACPCMCVCVCVGGGDVNNTGLANMRGVSHGNTRVFRDLQCCSGSSKTVQELLENFLWSLKIIILLP
jgi:hypothetical protein